MRLSVVIPTHRRPDILRECLTHLERQTLAPDQFEVVVCVDGPCDETRRLLASYAGPLQLRFLEQPQAGQGNARNRAIAYATGDVVVLIGDDIFLHPDALTIHQRVHQENPRDADALLGYIDWDPRLPATPIQTFLTTGGIFFGRFGGHQFAYDRLEGRADADYRFFYSSHLSLKRRLLLDEPFDPEFQHYGWEDIELGYRLWKRRGLRLHYRSTARGLHFHPMDEAAMVRRMHAIGRSTHLFQRKHPELRVVPTGTKRALLQLGANDLSLRALEPLARRVGGRWLMLYYYLRSKRSFLVGVREGLPC